MLLSADQLNWQPFCLTDDAARRWYGLMKGCQVLLVRRGGWVGVGHVAVGVWAAMACAAKAAAAHKEVYKEVMWVGGIRLGVC